eukprot:GEMP01063088.1.p1 GENE.GEMP01063088.1~~GEMP01063088.1.p1  ORF type:complete len:191 (+),score=31.82 GEMP01063088.1:98-670(+)
MAVVVRPESEIDCIGKCIHGTKSGGCPGACVPEMKGCLCGILSLRHGTFAFAFIDFIWNLVRLLWWYQPWHWGGRDRDDDDYRQGYHILSIIGGILAIILLVASVLGMIGAFKRDIFMIKFYIWSHALATIFWLVLAVWYMVAWGNVGHFINWVFHLLWVWWMFAVGTNLIRVLQNGGTGEENDTPHIRV